LWLAIHLPSLPLEVFPDAPGEGPLAVVEPEGSRQRVVAVNDCAVRHGVEAGQPLTAAWALAPALEILERNGPAEQAALERLAVWAGRFSSAVSLEPPAGVLLEARGSLRLFGGLRAFRAEVGRGLAALGHRAQQGIAPTPLAALWLARAGDAEVVDAAPLLAGRIGRLPLACLDWPARTLTDLSTMGLRRVRDCLRLPRDGFARRFGPELLAELDRALGRRPDPRRPFEAPPCFAAGLELAGEIREAPRLLDAAARLLDALAGFLETRQGGVQSLELEFAHADRAVSSLRLGLSAPSRDPAHLRELLAGRLERLELPAPVLGLRLRSGAVRHLPPSDLLLRAPRRPGLRLPRLVERLRARLGEEAVHGLCLLPDHRPETAWRRTTYPQGSGNGDIPDFRETKIRNVPISPWTSGRRPLWMLAEPQRLPRRQGRPCHRGVLTFESGPERIETGWWDGRDVARDYYVATNPRGMRLWIFRQRRGGRHWFLHGIFG
jgi:protein ImuB